MPLCNILNNFIKKDSALNASSIFNSNNIDELVITVFIAVISIFLAFGEDVTSRAYQKKYIVICYFTILAEIEFFNNPFIFIIVTFLIISFISGINLAYQSDNLEKELGKAKLVIYKMIQWFFVTKSYLFWSCILILFIANNLFVLPFWVSYNAISAFIVVLSFIYHLSSNMIDKFQVKSFDKVRNEILESRKLFDDNNKNNAQLLGYLIYMEDKDYFIRNNPIINFKAIIKRKFNIDLKIINIGKVFKVIRNCIKSYINKEVYSNSESKVKVKRKLSKYTSGIYKLLKYAMQRYFRGYSTIETQFFRTRAMAPNSYIYTVRRKIFVEIIYSIAFFSAWKAFIKSCNSCKDNDKCINYIKVCILKSYYKEVLESPTDYDQLISKFRSRLNTKTYESFLGQYEDEEKGKYISMIEEHFKYGDEFYKTFILL